jgi:hypothetical protein
MTVDQYAICPCGNGKKIKFCKCKESLPELDRVMTMIDGRQVVPAIDKLNQVLSEHPDAAWALAIKGRLMLDLRDYNALAENSERFVRLQPSNPLALAQRSAAELFRDEPEKATLSLLEALTESARSVDTFVLDIASILAYSLANSGLYLTARAYVQLPLTAQGYEANQTAAMVYQELNSSPQINQLLKTVPAPLPRDEDATWGERFDEAVGLLRSNQILLAESKLQSLARTVPREPCVLTGLLTCAIWRGDAESQTDCLRKLSECESLDLHDRSKYLAMSWLVDPSRSKITVPCLNLDAEISNVEETEVGLSANGRFISLGSDVLAQFRESADGIPPRAGYQLIDRDPASDEAVKNGQDYPRSIALIFIYGKQTDRAARIEVIEARPAYQKEVKVALNQALPGLTWNEAPGRSLSIVEALEVPIVALREPAENERLDKIQRAYVEKNFASDLAELSLGCFDSRTLAACVDDESTRVARTALVRLLESDESLEDHHDVIMSAVRAIARVEPVESLTPASPQECDLIDAADLARVDVTNLEPMVLLYLFQRARVLHSSKLLYRAANKIVELDLEGNLKQAKILAYTVLVEFATSKDEAAELLKNAKAYASAHGIDQANLLLMELTQHLMNGDSVGFSNVVRTLTDQYSNRPDVMARLQQLLISVGFLRPDGTVRERGMGGGSDIATSPASSSSGIWTPGSGVPAAASAGTNPSGGGSKLWVPGMD